MSGGTGGDLSWEIWDRKAARLIADFPTARAAIGYLAENCGPVLDDLQIERVWRGTSKVFAQGRAALSDLIDSERRLEAVLRVAKEQP